MVLKHHIKPHNLWNFDEKGFLIGMCHASKRIVPLKSLKKGQIKGTLQDGNREFISLLAAVSAAGEKMSPSLIYQSESGDLQDSWLEDFDHCNQKAYFAASKKGWTSDEHGMMWLTRFHNETIERAANGLQKRLLLLDGHSSHVNWAFVQKAIAYNILIVVFPPHSTHRLQPLDVSVFSPLASYYHQNLDKFIQSSRGFSRMTKRCFWKVFLPAWEMGVRLETITSGFAKTGISPWAPELVVDQVTLTNHYSSTDSSDEEITIAKSCQEVRELGRTVHNRRQMVSAPVRSLIASLEVLVTENAILRLENGDLYATLINEVGRRKRGKKMGLNNEEEPKYGQFYSPTKIGAIRAQKEADEAQKEQEKADKEDKKLQSRIARDLKDEQHRQRVQDNKNAREKRKQDKEAERLFNRHAKELFKAFEAFQLSPQKPKKPSRTTKKGKSSGGEVSIPVSTISAPPSTITRSGRIARPSRKILE